MALTVFYSWQSDCPPRTNRNFIEDALKRALRKINTEADVVSSARDVSVVLDKDTAGLAGTPAIAEAIFKKIDECAVFVPDLTFVAKTGAGRPTPNPNVLIEYGWALKSRGLGRIVPVMNEAFGSASETALPFNMRHLRWPLVYTLPDGSATDRTDIREKLASGLAHAIRAVLDSTPTETSTKSPFNATPSTYDKAVFFQPKEAPAIREGNEKMLAPEKGAKMFVRLIPSGPTEQLLRRQAYDLAIGGGLQPFTLQRFTGGEWHSMNKYGAIVYRSTNQGHFRHLTQLFASRELWGITFELSTDRYSDKMHGFWDEGEGWFNFLPAFFEAAFIRGLEQYRRFARENLQLALPFELKGGITGIEGFKISAPEGMGFGGHARYGGMAHETEITFETVLRDPEEPSEIILKPFFRRVWDGFGLERPETAR
jgi:hypothetical protein